MNHKKRHILVLLGWSDPRILAGIGHYAKEHNWHLAMHYLYNRELPQHWAGDGAIVSTSADPEFNAFITRILPHIPSVNLGAGLGGLETVHMRLRDEEAGRMAARYFMGRGCCNFAWFSTTDNAVDRLRSGSFRQELESVGHACHMLFFPRSSGKDRQQRSKWLAGKLGWLPKPLAIFAADDVYAAEVIEECLYNGLRVPEDVAVLGLGNIELACECSHVPISSVEYDFEQWGYTAAKALDWSIDGKDTGPLETEHSPVRIVPRQSTNAYTVDDPRLQRAIRYMRSHLSKDISVQDIAEAAEVPARTLQALFKQHLHRSPAHFLLELRLDQACEMLLADSRPIIDIAAACGFNSARSINRCFNRELGVSPRAYRQSPTTLPPFGLGSD